MKKRSIIIVFLLLLFSLGCFNSDYNRKQDKKATISKMPTGAKNIKYIGNGWAYFTIENKRFLACLQYRNSCITQVKE